MFIPVVSLISFLPWQILEERKDPPREKLFNVLGKIFKVTERNQALVRTAEEPERSHKRTRKPRNSEKPNTDEQHPESELALLATANKGEQSQQQAVLSNNAIEGIATTKGGDELQAADLEAIGLGNLALHDEADLDDPEEPCVPTAFPSTMSSRYPSTMRAWSRTDTDRDNVMRQSWSQLGTLN